MFLSVSLYICLTSCLYFFHLGGLISRAADLAYSDIRHAKDDKKKAKDWANELSAKLSEFKIFLPRRSPDTNLTWKVSGTGLIRLRMQPKI